VPRLRSILGYSGAVLTLVVALLTPFLLYGWFQKAIGAAGLRIHPVYSGGDVSRVIQRDGYSIQVNRPVLRQTPLERVDSFVQITWTPAGHLPPRVSDEVDLDRDGKSDLLVQFEVPQDPALKLAVDVKPLGGRIKAMHVDGVESFSALIARVKDGIVVRVPLAP
jgi:hypothetical protein